MIFMNLLMEIYVRTSKKPKQPWWRLTRDEVFKLIPVIAMLAVAVLAKCAG